jgi:tetratricopeptide (TPR) repeat protein
VEYQKSLADKESSFGSNYNFGNALYKSNEIESCIDHYKAACSDKNTKSERAMAYHNLGNAYVMGEKYQEAVDAYKESLRLNPKDNDTRFNYTYAKKMLQQQQQQQQQQQDPKQDQNKDGKEQNSEEQHPEAKERERKMDSDQAKQILEALENDEKERQKQKAMVKDVKMKKVDKDW